MSEKLHVEDFVFLKESNILLSITHHERHLLFFLILLSFCMFVILVQRGKGKPRWSDSYETAVLICGLCCFLSPLSSLFLAVFVLLLGWDFEGFCECIFGLRSNERSTRFMVSERVLSRSSSILVQRWMDEWIRLQRERERERGERLAYEVVVVFCFQHTAETSPTLLDPCARSRVSLPFVLVLPFSVISL